MPVPKVNKKRLSRKPGTGVFVCGRMAAFFPKGTNRKGSAQTITDVSQLFHPSHKSPCATKPPHWLTSE